MKGSSSISGFFLQIITVTSSWCLDVRMKNVWKFETVLLKVIFSLLTGLLKGIFWWQMMLTFIYRRKLFHTFDIPIHPLPSPSKYLGTNLRYGLTHWLHTLFLPWSGSQKGGMQCHMGQWFFKSFSKAIIICPAYSLMTFCLLRRDAFTKYHTIKSYIFVIENAMRMWLSPKDAENDQEFFEAINFSDQKFLLIFWQGCSILTRLFLMPAK